MNHAHPQYNQTQELSHFYQEVIMDHFKHPRFKGSVQDCRFCQEGKNPLCGDVISLYCKVLLKESALPKNESILQVHFDGSGCSISQASASIMCEIVHNMNVQEAKCAIQNAEKVYTGKKKVNPENMESDMDALHGIGQFPARIKCAALPWKTLECLLAENFDTNGCPKASSCEKHLNAQKQTRKLKIVSTEI